MRDESGVRKGLSFPSLSDNKEEGTRDRHVSIQDDCGSTSGEDPGRERTRSRHNFSGDVASERPRTMKHRVLIVDDDEAIRTQMKWALSQDYEIHFAEDRKGALEVFEANSPAVTLLDLGLPPRPNECDEGLATLSEILAVDGTAKVIIVSGQGEKRNAIEAVGAGAYDFLCKPVEMEELRLLPRRFIVAASARAGLLSRSTATRFPKTFWRANFSVTKKAPLRALMCSAKACWKQPVAAHSFWMRLASFHRRFR